MPAHSGKSSKSRRRTIRFRNETYDEIEAYAKRHGMTFNAVVEARCVALRDRRHAVAPDVNKASIFDALAEARAAAVDELATGKDDGNDI